MEPSKTSRHPHIRVVMCLNQLLECFGEAMIVPYYPHAMDLTSKEFGVLLALQAISKLVSSLVVGLYTKKDYASDLEQKWLYF